MLWTSSLQLVQTDDLPHLLLLYFDFLFISFLRVISSIFGRLRRPKMLKIQNPGGAPSAPRSASFCPRLPHLSAASRQEKKNYISHHTFFFRQFFCRIRQFGFWKIRQFKLSIFYIRHFFCRKKKVGCRWKFSWFLSIGPGWDRVAWRKVDDLSPKSREIIIRMHRMSKNFAARLNNNQIMGFQPVNRDLVWNIWNLPTLYLFFSTVFLSNLKSEKKVFFLL